MNNRTSNRTRIHVQKSLFCFVFVCKITRESEKCNLMEACTNSDIWRQKILPIAWLTLSRGSAKDSILYYYIAGCLLDTICCCCIAQIELSTIGIPCLPILWMPIHLEFLFENSIRMICLVFVGAVGLRRFSWNLLRIISSTNCYSCNVFIFIFCFMKWCKVLNK